LRGKKEESGEGRCKRFANLSAKGAGLKEKEARGVKKYQAKPHQLYPGRGGGNTVLLNTPMVWSLRKMRKRGQKKRSNMGKPRK